MNLTLSKGVSHINPEYNHVLEFGVYRGGTLRQLRNQLPSNFQLYGFDSFLGLPENWTGTNFAKGHFSTQGQPPSIPGVEFFVGLFKDTLPQYKLIAKPIALLHIDCDLYSSTIEVLYELKDYILPGTVICFDEWYYNNNDIEQNRQHEQKAFLEWAKEFGIKYEEFPVIERERKMLIIK